MKINIEYDTKEKTLVARKNGKTIDNITSLEFYPKWDEDGKYSLHLAQSNENENEGMREMHITSAAVQVAERLMGKTNKKD